MMNLKEASETLRQISFYLVHIFSGSLIIGNAYYSIAGNIHYNYGQSILTVLDYMSLNIFKFSVFLLASWIIGLFVAECVSLIPISKSKKLLRVKSKLSAVNFNLAVEATENEKHKAHFNLFRVVMTSHALLASLGSAFLISFLFLLVAFIMNHKIIDLILSLLFISFALICEIGNRKTGERLDKILRWILRQEKATK